MQHIAIETGSIDKRTCVCLLVFPQGAYYVLADVSRLSGETSKEKAMHLLSKTGVAGVPEEAFFHGADGNNLIRFCFAKRDDELEEAARRLELLE